MNNQGYLYSTLQYDESVALHYDGYCSVAPQAERFWIFVLRSEAIKRE